MDPILERYQALEDKVASYTPNLDTKRLFEAFTYADTEHHGQLRKSGEPYIIHPLAVADIVADLGLDVDSVIAALLHDCIEDTTPAPPTRRSPKNSAPRWPTWWRESPS